MKTIIERGASWTLEETKLLLHLWGQDFVQRQKTNLKRTKEVYEKIAEKFNQNGFERTSDQVRTRVFNMIAEYRRILKDPNPERMKKCIFFDALHKIYQAKHMDDVRNALDDYEPDCPFSPASNTFMSEKGDESISEGDAATGGDSEAGGANRNNKSVETNSTNKNNANTNNNNHPPETPNNSASIDLPEENQDTLTNDNNTEANNGTQNSSITTAGSTASLATNDSDSTVKHYKIRTQNNEVMLLKVIEGEVANSPSNKKFKIEKFKSCSCDNASSDGKCQHDKTCSNHSSNTSSATNKQQSLLLPHASSAVSASTSTATANIASTSTPTTSKPGVSNNTYISINNAKIPLIRSNGIGDASGNNLTSTPTRIQPTTATVASHHQLYPAPVNTFDVTSSALLIDRMFAHLSRESENMREWIALEKERLALERVKKLQETEREVRRERVLVDTLMRFQEQWISFLGRLDPKVLNNPPPKTPTQNSTSSSDQTTQSQTTLAATQPVTSQQNDEGDQPQASGSCASPVITKEEGGS